MAPIVADPDAAAPVEGAVELLDLSITLHYREHPASADEVAATARAVAADAGLHVRPAKMSVELHPPIDEDKGTAIERLAGNSPGAVMYLGDDVGDHPAFDALDRLAATGRPVLRVVAVSDEVDPSLEARADVAVDGPAGVRDLLASLLD